MFLVLYFANKDMFFSYPILAVLTHTTRKFMTHNNLISKCSTVGGQHGHATHPAQSPDLKVPQPNYRYT